MQANTPVKFGNKISIIGVASCYGAKDMRCADAPVVIQKLADTPLFKHRNNINWIKNIYPEHTPVSSSEKSAVIAGVCKQLSKQVRKSVTNREPFIVIGGDHSCAIGTWSGAHAAIQNSGELGLIWIDAHMDSHTTATSSSGAIHGMPLACLLGAGEEALTHIETPTAKLKPANLCLIGIRSFEVDEAALLEAQGVKIFYIEEVESVGIEKVLAQAKQHVCQNTVGYGISLDLDAIDPRDAPGVGSPEKNGLNADELVNAFSKQAYSEKFLGLEIAELNSMRDIDDKTAKLTIRLINSIFK